MADMAERDLTGTAKAQNLARIRDNQRRSRARRKEYLQELETKYRHCEQVGVEASADIQAAARRVLDENRRLRELLKQQGFSDADIDGRPAYHASTPLQVSSAYGLEDMLATKRSCGSSCEDGDDSNRNRRQSCAPVMQTQTNSGLSVLQEDRKKPAMMMIPQRSDVMQLTSPGSQSSSNISTPATRTLFNDPATVRSDTGRSAGLEHLENYGLLYDETYDWSHHLPEHSQYREDELRDIDGGTSSCYVAAGAIRSIKPDIGYELEEELGCGDGRECEVQNSDIFTIMDRYQGTSR